MLRFAYQQNNTKKLFHPIKVMTRKNFLASSFLTAAALSLQSKNLAKTGSFSIQKGSTNIADQKMKICIFSKQLQWLNYQEMATAVADMGYDGIDLTVRKGGHVLPEKVAEDLPKAVEAATKAGIKGNQTSKNYSQWSY